MSRPTPASHVLAALDALKRYDRDHAASLLRRELLDGRATGDRWKSVATLAARIGEINVAIEAAGRYAATNPQILDRILYYAGELAAFGRTDEALATIRQLPPSTQQHPQALHFLATIAGERGNFEEAERYYRRALDHAPYQAPSWFGLSMIKTFTTADADLARMEALLPSFAGAAPALRARFLYGLAKAWHDCGEYDRAFALYASGAALRREERRFDAAALSDFADRLIRDFTPSAMASLIPARSPQNRAIFVNGLPRSGTTLVEQILTSHSAVADGGEVNLIRAALIATGDYSIVGARTFQHRAETEDPWGDLARAYQRMLAERFGSEGRLVDKTLGQSHFMGLLLHMLPQARIVWMRRSPEDTALSCFRTFFTASVPWSWSLTDIGAFFRIEDRLFEHWRSVAPERILVVPYEELVRDPPRWTAQILDHTGLAMEPGVLDFHQTTRSVRTASVQQVRQPVSPSRIGASKAYSTHLDAFQAAYSA